jgi:ornithine decarboxylase
VSSTEPDNPRLAAALAAATDDQVILDLAGVLRQYDDLVAELPGARVRFALKACPVDAVIAGLVRRGSGIDAASVAEIRHAFAAGARPADTHFGNTVKSDVDIATAFRLGVRDFATDTVEDVAAIAANAPGSRVFCRLATDGAGALWGLAGKCGCAGPDAVRVLERARELDLTPAGLSVHVGSQQLTVRAWQDAFDRLAATITALAARGIALDHVNLGGGLPALGYLDRAGRPLNPPLPAIFAAIRAGMRRLRALSPNPLEFVVEPGRHLVADHGAIRARVSRLAARRRSDGVRQHWLYLSCGRFNGLYETDQVRYPMIFPGHEAAARVPAVVAGPSCDSDDVFGAEHEPALVPDSLASGDPVWILGCGAYAVSYTTVGFNGFPPLRQVVLPAEEPTAPPRELLRLPG